VTAELVLVADFIERLANPTYGRVLNEQYSQRFADAVGDDEEFVGRLADRTLRASDVPTFTTAAWLWFLAWRRPHSTAPPAADFLDALFEDPDPLVRVRVIQEVTWHPTTVEAMAGVSAQDVPLSDLPVPWLPTRLFGIVHNDREFAVAEAQDIALSLVQLGDDVSLRTLGAFLRVQWRGQDAVAAIVDDALPPRPANEYEVDAEYARWRGLLGR
jgi:hypothetical protein